MQRFREVKRLTIEGRSVDAVAVRDIAVLVGFSGDALEWGRGLNAQLGLRFDKDYDVPGSPTDYMIYYTVEAAEKIVAHFRQDQPSTLPQIFMFDGCGVRIIERDGEPWFVAADVATVLGYSNTRDAVARHCRGVAKHDAPSSSGNQEYTIIPERDVYRLIMRSKLPSAERFEEWVVGEVLPAIRKTGSYHPTPQIPQTLPEALRLAADLAEQVESQKREMIEMKPKVDALHRLADSEGTFCLSDAGKALQLPPRKFIASLQAAGWIYRRVGNRNYIAYQDKIKAGYLVHKITAIPSEADTDRVSEQVRVTAKGLARLAEMMAKRAA